MPTTPCTLSAWDTPIGGELFAVFDGFVPDAALSLTLAYRFAGLSGWVDGLGRLTDTPAQFSASDLDIPLPETFYDQIPDAPSAPFSLTLTTYQQGKVVGTPYEKTVTVYADPALCAPVLTGWDIKDINPVSQAITGEEYNLIRHLSTARCQVSAYAQKGAKLTSVKLAGVTGSLLDLPRVDLETLPVELTDSRGMVTRAGIPLDLIPYRQLTNLATVTGLTPEGEAVLTFRGQWFSGEVCSRQTALSLSYRVNGGSWQTVDPQLSGDEYTACVTLTGLSYTQNAALEAKVSDGLVEETVSLTARSAKPVFDWGATDFRVNVPACIGGVYMQSVYVENSQKLTLTAKGNGRQVFWLLGTANWGGRVTGVLWTRADRGDALWDGNPEVEIAAQTLSPQPDGTTWVTVELRLPVNAWDHIVILSNQPIFPG